MSEKDEKFFFQHFGIQRESIRQVIDNFSFYIFAYFFIFLRNKCCLETKTTWLIGSIPLADYIPIVQHVHKHSIASGYSPVNDSRSERLDFYNIAFQLLASRFFFQKEKHRLDQNSSSRNSFRNERVVLQRSFSSRKRRENRKITSTAGSPADCKKPTRPKNKGIVVL